MLYTRGFCPSDRFFFTPIKLMPRLRVKSSACSLITSRSELLWATSKRSFSLISWYTGSYSGVERFCEWLKPTGICIFHLGGNNLPAFTFIITSYSWVLSNARCLGVWSTEPKPTVCIRPVADMFSSSEAFASREPTAAQPPWFSSSATRNSLNQNSPLSPLLPDTFLIPTIIARTLPNDGFPFIT